jgi:hypothetical protein
MFSISTTSLTRALNWRLFQLSAMARQLTPGELRLEAGDLIFCGVLAEGRAEA